MASHYARRLPEFTHNLLHLYRHETTVADCSLGNDWYDNAHRMMQEWSDSYGFSIATCACVTAAISPQCEWSRNLIIADDILAGRIPSIYGALPLNVSKAQRIANDRASNMLDYFPQGPKVSSFACNLAGDYDVVTVDTHAVQAACGDVEVTISLHWPAYAVFAEAYQRAAIKAHLQPAVFQAIIWHTWKRLHPRVSKIQRRRQWHVVGEAE